MRWRGTKWNEEGLKEQRGVSHECLSHCSVEGLAGEWHRGTVLSGGGDKTTMANGACCGLRGIEEKTTGTPVEQALLLSRRRQQAQGVDRNSNDEISKI